MNKRECLAEVFREFGNKGILDADNLRRALDELDHLPESEIDRMYEIFVFTVDNIS